MPPIEPARISSSVMVKEETPPGYARTISTIHFKIVEPEWGIVGSPVQRWYRKVAQGQDAVRGSREEGTYRGVKGRLIAWKTGQPFEPNGLFFRSVDTARLLPMHCADFIVQMYAHPSTWEHIGTLDPRGRNVWRDQAMAKIIHELLLLRNMHDRGGGDIPVIVTDWDAATTQRALDYWVQLSKGRWSRIERNSKCKKIH